MSKQFLRRISFIAATLLIIVSLCGCGQDTREHISMDHYPSTAPQTQDGEDEESDTDGEQASDVQTDGRLYVITHIDTQNRLIVFGLPDSLRTVQYTYTQGTQILDSHGQFISVERLTPGRVVMIGDPDSEARLTLVQLAPQVVYQENITRFSIDDSIGMLVIGDTKYRYNQYLRVFSGDQQISLSQIKEGDVLRVEALDKQILSVQVTLGHGTIALTNTKLFEGGWISLGTKIYAKITKDMTLEVPEGEYELSVANDGYGDKKTVQVERGQVTTIDLDEYKGEGPKLCKVTFEVHVPDALLYIDGEEVNYEHSDEKPIELRYGVYQLTVIADGYETWERQLVIHSEDAVIQIGEPQLSETSSSSEGTSDTQGSQSSSSASQNTAGTGITSHLSDDDGDSTASGSQNQTSSGGTGTSASGTDGNTSDYSDYLDTITDLIQSLTDSNT